MKKIILTSGLFLFAFVTFSQEQENKETIILRHSNIDIVHQSFKTSLLNKAEATMQSTLGVYANEVNEKVLKSFNEIFAAAQEVKWEEFKSYYTVSFVHYSIRCKVSYDKKGYVVGSFRYYSPENLPLNIYNKLRKDHSKMELFGVTEVTVEAEVIYFVKMQDEKNWITMKIDPTEKCSVYEKYRKA